MGDGKALQMGTSHELGQNFARAFGIEYLDDTGAQQIRVDDVVGRRRPGMVGGADHGPRRRRRPARAAPAGARSRWSCSRCATRATSSSGCRALTDELAAAGVRAQLDDRTGRRRSGRRATDWELKGVPVRLEVGPRDLADGVVTLVRRIVTGDEDRKAAVPLDGVAGAVTAELERQQCGAARRRDRDARAAHRRRHDPRRRPATPPPTAGPASPGTRWASTGEAELAQAGVTVRCLVRADGSLPDTDDEPELVALVGRAY